MFEYTLNRPYLRFKRTFCVFTCEIPRNINVALSENEINLIIHNLREATTDDFPENLFNEVVQKVMDMYNQGKIASSFRGYLATALFDRIKKQGIKTMKDDARKQMLLDIANAKSEIKIQQNKVFESMPFYNWLDKKQTMNP